MAQEFLSIPQALDLALRARSAGQLQEAENIYRTILQALPDNSDAQKGLWETRREKGDVGEYFSQFGQDEFIHQQFFASLHNGFFLDIGAYDGVTGSNTFFFENRMNWGGICFEPSPSQFAVLEGRRRCKTFNYCICNFDGEATFLEIESGYLMMGGLVEHYDPRALAAVQANPEHRGREISVPVKRLPPILEQEGITRVDYCSIDVEGSELPIIRDFDFERVHVEIMSIENNYDDPQIPAHMKSVGFEYVAKVGQDQIFRHK